MDITHNVLDAALDDTFEGLAGGLQALFDSPQFEVLRRIKHRFAVSTDAGWQVVKIQKVVKTKNQKNTHHTFCFASHPTPARAAVL